MCKIISYVNNIKTNQICKNMCRRNNKDTYFRYMGFPMIDAPTTDISRYFYVAAKFIDSAISNGGKCNLNNNI